MHHATCGKYFILRDTAYLHIRLWMSSRPQTIEKNYFGSSGSVLLYKMSVVTLKLLKWFSSFHTYILWWFFSDPFLLLFIFFLHGRHYDTPAILQLWFFSLLIWFRSVKTITYESLHNIVRFINGVSALLLSILPGKTSILEGIHGWELRPTFRGPRLPRWMEK